MSDEEICLRRSTAETDPLTSDLWIGAQSCILPVDNRPQPPLNRPEPPSNRRERPRNRLESPFNGRRQRHIDAWETAFLSWKTAIRRNVIEKVSPSAAERSRTLNSRQ
jgi:hypothetical protein